MRSIFWELGEPARFAERVADALREGRNVVVCLPEHTPAGLAAAVRKAMDDGCGYSWHSLSLDGGPTGRPAEYLARRILPHVPPTTALNAGSLASDNAFAGRLVWVQDVNACDWPAWADFLAEYSHACRARSLLQRTLLCVPLVGRAAEAPPAEDICLACHTWRGVVDSFDMLLFCSNLVRNWAMPVVYKRLLIAVVAALSLWDPEVAEKLVAAGGDRVLDPIPVLREIAQQRGWTPELLLSARQDWRRGMTQTMDGEEKTHSAALALSDPTNEIARRIWSAEVGVLLPYVEEQRQAILRRLSGLLSVPFETRFGETITDWRDLEIGHIESQIVIHGLPVARDIRRQVRQLREIRNCLAHQEPVPGDLLQDVLT